MSKTKQEKNQVFWGVRLPTADNGEKLNRQKNRQKSQQIATKCFLWGKPLNRSALSSGGRDRPAACRQQVHLPPTAGAPGGFTCPVHRLALTCRRLEERGGRRRRRGRGGGGGPRGGGGRGPGPGGGGLDVDDRGRGGGRPVAAAAAAALEGVARGPVGGGGGGGHGRARVRVLPRGDRGNHPAAARLGVGRPGCVWGDIERKKKRVVVEMMCGDEVGSGKEVCFVSYYGLSTHQPWSLTSTSSYYYNCTTICEIKRGHISRFLKSKYISKVSKKPNKKPRKLSESNGKKTRK